MTIDELFGGGPQLVPDSPLPPRNATDVFATGPQDNFLPRGFDSGWNQERDAPSMGQRLGQVLGLARKPYDIATSAIAGLNDPVHKPVRFGDQLQAAIFPDRGSQPEPVPAMQWIPDPMTQVGAGIDELSKTAPKTAKVISDVIGTGAGVAANMVSDPVTYAPLGILSKLGKAGVALQGVISAAFAGQMGKQAYDRAFEIADRIKKNGITLDLVKPMTQYVLEAGGAVLGAHGVQRDVAGFAEQLAADRQTAAATESVANSFRGQQETPPSGGGAAPAPAPVVESSAVTDLANFRAAMAKKYQKTHGVSNWMAVISRSDRAKLQALTEAAQPVVDIEATPAPAGPQQTAGFGAETSPVPSNEPVIVDPVTPTGQPATGQQGLKAPPGERLSAAQAARDTAQKLNPPTAERPPAPVGKPEPWMGTVSVNMLESTKAGLVRMRERGDPSFNANVLAHVEAELSRRTAAAAGPVDFTNAPEGDLAVMLENARRELSKTGPADKGGLVRDREGNVIDRLAPVGRKDLAGIDPKVIGEPNDRIAAAIEKDGDNPLYLRVKAHLADQLRAQKDAHAQTNAPGELGGDFTGTDASFDPAALETAPTRGLVGRQQAAIDAAGPGAASNPLIAKKPGEIGALQIGKPRDILKMRAGGEQGVVLDYNPDGTATVRFPSGTRTVKQEDVFYVGKETLGGGVSADAPRAVDPALPPEVGKLVSALDQAKATKSVQTKLYESKMAQRKAALAAAALKPGESSAKALVNVGKAPPRNANFNPVRERLSQQDINALQDSITSNKKLSGDERQAASKALGRLLDEGRIPNDNEMNALDQVFGKSVTEAVLQHRGIGSKLVDLANLPRALKSSVDMSFPLRQGLILSVGNPKIGAKAFVDMHKAFVSEKWGMTELKNHIENGPNAQLYKEAGLYVVGKTLSRREESFMSNLAEKIPLVGRSERAFQTAGGTLRVHTFDSMVRDATKATGRELTLTEHQAIADFINKATGRGNIGETLGRGAPLINAFFFSPRFLASRFQVLDPRIYDRLPPGARKQAIVSMAATAGLVTTALSMASLGGAKVESDTRSSDFGNIKIGNTRLDVWAGLRPDIRLIGQFVASARKRSDGRIVPDTRKKILEQFTRGKVAPVPAVAWDALDESTLQGDQPTPLGEASALVSPMFLTDLANMLTTPEGRVELAPLAFYGAGVNTYRPEWTPKVHGLANVMKAGWETDKRRLKKYGNKALDLFRQPEANQ